MKNLKTRIAAGATIVGLGGLTGLALSAGHQKSAPIAAKPLVRTKVIRRTIHVTKHVKPKHPVGAGAGMAGGAGSYAGSAVERQRHHRRLLDRLRAFLLLFLRPCDDCLQRRIGRSPDAPAQRPSLPIPAAHTPAQVAVAAALRSSRTPAAVAAVAVAAALQW